MKRSKKFAIVFISIMFVIVVPLIYTFIDHKVTEWKLKKAVAAHYLNYCEEPDVQVQVKADYLQPLSFLPGGIEQRWEAVVDNRDELEGHFGFETITLRNPPCLTGPDQQLVFHPASGSFKFAEEVWTFTHDTRGLPVFAYLFYIFVYPSVFMIGVAFWFAFYLEERERRKGTK